MTHCCIYGRLRIRKASDLSTVFTYKLNTGGLNLYQANGRYFLAESKTSVDRIELGDVVTFDARGKFSVGSMTAQTIMAGQAYLLTLTVDEAFLTDENTTYPVTIDPTIEVSDKETAGNIEDVSIYSGRPTTNGNWTFLHSGYYDDTYKVARTLVRLKGLTSSSIYASLSDSNITKAEFHIFEATGSAPVAVELYSITGNSAWTESGVNWNNAGYTLGTKYATASPSYNQKTVYNITNLVKAWKNGSETAACGFVLKSTNETSVDKAFLSSEYATTASRPCVKLTYTSEVSLNSTSFAIDEGSSRTLTATTSDGGTVTWSSSNTTVATVTSGGRVTGVKARKATITATMTDGTSASSVVYVTIADGVYRIKSSSIGLFLGTYGSIAENTSARMLAYSNEGLTQLQQLWKITYIASGYYSIRPMHKLNMTLHANGTSGSSVDIVTSGTTDTPSSILAVNCWGICVTSDGTAYNINHINTSSLGMRYADGATSPGLGVITEVSSSTSGAFRWHFDIVEDPPSGTILYDISTSYSVELPTRYVAVGETKSLLSLNLMPVSYSGATNSVSFTWANTGSFVSVNQYTGAVTALSASENYALVTGSCIYGTVQLKVYVLPVQDGIYFVKNRAYDKYLQIDDNDTSNNFSSSGTIMEQWTYDGGDYQKWKISSLLDGYYSIISAKSSLALSVPSGQTESADVTLVQETYNGLDRQKWKIIKTDSDSFKISPKSSEGLTNQLVIAVGYNEVNDSDGVNIEQRYYVNDTNYKDEWKNANASALLSFHTSSTSFSVQCLGETTLSEEWYSLIIAAKDSWNNSSVNSNISLTSSVSDFSCTVAEYPDKWYGLMINETVGNTTVSAVIQINTRTLTDSVSFRQGVIAYEIGHLLGLADNPEIANLDDSLMCYGRDKDLIFIPQAFDEYNVKFIYNLD